MKKTLFATGLAMAMALPFGASAADYVIDNKGAHASVNFKVSHLATVLSKVVLTHLKVTFLTTLQTLVHLK